jgi:hypothetical protein
MNRSGAMQMAGVHELAIAHTKVFIIQAQPNVLVDTGSGPLHDEVIAFLKKTGFAFESEEQKKLLKKGAYETIIRFLREKRITIDSHHLHALPQRPYRQLKTAERISPGAGCPARAWHPVVEGREQLAPPVCRRGGIKYFNLSVMLWFYENL